MKISVVVPAYNEQAYIVACLDGLMKQSVTPDEIIVVNNNSTDATVDIVKKYPVRIVHETEQGMIQARNRGFNEAKYDIIARTDSDTIVPVDWIKKIKKTFEDEEIVALSGPSVFYEMPTDLSKKAALQTLKSYFHLMKPALGHDCLYGPNMAIRKTTWDKAKNTVCLNDKEVHEDIDLAIHLAPFGKIKVDYTLIVNSSFRRFKRFVSYFEYPYRVVKSVSKHKQIVMEKKGKEFVKKIVRRAFDTLDIEKGNLR